MLSWSTHHPSSARLSVPRARKLRQTREYYCVIKTGDDREPELTESGRVSGR